MSLLKFEVNKIEKEESILGGLNQCVCYTKEIGASEYSDHIDSDGYHEW